MKNGNIKVPLRSVDSRVEKALAKAAIRAVQDGKWYRLLEMGFSTAEQTARGYNVPGGQFEFGYSHEASGSGELISVLWARWVGSSDG